MGHIWNDSLGGALLELGIACLAIKSSQDSPGEAWNCDACIRPLFHCSYFTHDTHPMIRMNDPGYMELDVKIVMDCESLHMLPCMLVHVHKLFTYARLPPPSFARSRSPFAIAKKFEWAGNVSALLTSSHSIKSGPSLVS